MIFKGEDIALIIALFKQRGFVTLGGILEGRDFLGAAIFTIFLTLFDLLWLFSFSFWQLINEFSMQFICGNFSF